MLDKKAAWTNIVLFMPSIVTFLILWLFRDAILTQTFLLATLAVLPKAYNKYCRRFIWLEDQELLSLIRIPAEERKTMALQSKKPLKINYFNIISSQSLHKYLYSSYFLAFHAYFNVFTSWT